MNMETLELVELFETWHKTTNQAKKYNLRYTKTIGVTGQVDYHDYRTNWAFLAFKAGFEIGNKDIKL